MNLVLHQFRKDVRQFRIGLAIWSGLLLLNLAVNLGWVGRVAYEPDHGYDHASNTWTGLLPNVIWLFVALLPSLVVLTDSPARREGFLATRPLPKRDLFLGKLLFIFALVIAPWTLQELVHLACAGVPAWVVRAGTLERLMFTLPVAVGFGAYAALWPGYVRWARALGITVIGGYLVAAMVALLAMFVFHDNNVDFGGSNLAQNIAAMDVAMLALIVLMVWHSRAHRGVFARWGGLALVAAAGILTMSCWPWNFFALRPQDPAAAVAAVPATPIAVAPRDLILRKIQDVDDKTERFTASLKPTLPALPPHDLIEWSPGSAKLLRAGGGGIQAQPAHESKIFNTLSWNNSYNSRDFTAWSADFPAEVLFRQNNYYGQNEAGYLDLGKFKLPVSPEQLGEPLTLQADYKARVFQWHQLADLPLTPGATATDAFGSWKFIATKSDVSSKLTQFFFQRHQIELATATDSRCSTAEYGALTRMAFMVYDPLQNIVWMPDQNSFISTSRGTETAVADYFSTFFLSGQKAFTKEELARCRLVIFEKSWLGTVPASSQSPAFTLADKLQPLHFDTAGNQDPMPRAEFDRHLAALKAPAPDASRQEVSLYLLDYLRLVDAQRFTLGLHDPHTRQLAAYVPAHLDLLLDGLPVMDHASRTTVMNALKLGATEAQKPAIIAALQHDPELAGVLFARGWVTDARTEIYQLAQSSRPLPIAAFQAIASFHDPETYPRLLAEFSYSHSLEADDVLHTLPELAPQTDAIVARLWHEDSMVIRSAVPQLFDQNFQLAMHHGQASALRRVYTFLNSNNFDQAQSDWQLGYALWKTVQITGVRLQDRGQSDIAVAWMRKHQPEDFVFNPALRQFVLKAAPPAGQPFTASNP